MKRLLFIAAFVFSSTALADTRGDDQLRNLFEQARTEAVKLVDSLQWCSFQLNVPQKQIDWILENQQTLSKDLHGSSHLWVVDSQPTCAFTSKSSQSNIYLSYPTCASTIGSKLDGAVFVLLHETMHHMGIADEKQADYLANVIVGQKRDAVCPVLPNVDVFDPLICQGPDFTLQDAVAHMQVAGHEATFGQYTTYGRSRQCNQLTGCKPWQQLKTFVFNRNAKKSPNSEDNPNILDVEKFPIKVRTISIAAGFEFDLSNTQKQIMHMNRGRYANDCPYCKDQEVSFTPLRLLGFGSLTSGLFTNLRKGWQYEFKGTVGDHHIVGGDSVLMLEGFPPTDDAYSFRSEYKDDHYHGSLKRDCGWFSPGIQRIDNSSSGNYKELQIVLFGTH